MIDLNHGSGCQYDAVSRGNGIGAAVNAAIDAALLARHRAQPPRRYVSTSGLGRACLRQIQYDYLAVPKDDGREFEPSTLRIFEAGHRGEDVVAGWLRAAGFDLRTHRADGRQFGFSALDGRFRGHIDGCLVAGPASMAYPALWEHKTLGARSWKDVVKRGAASANVSVEDVRAIEDRLRAIPMDLFLAELGFSAEEIVYDPVAHVWIIPDRQYKGTNTGILVVREDKSFICAEISRAQLS